MVNKKPQKKKHKGGKKEIIGVSSFAHDITDRKKAEEALKQSEEKFQTIIENAQPIIFMTDKKGIFTLSEGKMLSVLGLKPGQLVGKSALKMYKNYPAVIKGIKMALNGKVSNDIIDVGGVFFDIFYSPHRGPKGKVIGIIGMAVDITKRKELEEKVAVTNKTLRLKTKQMAKVINKFSTANQKLLTAEKTIRESEEKFRSLFEHSTTGIAYHKMVYNKKGKPVDYIFLDINPTFTKLTGLTRKKMIGKRVTKAIPGIEKDHIDWIGLYGKVAKTGNPISFEQYAAPLKRWYSVFAFKTEKDHFVTVFLDITERKKAKERFEELFNSSRDAIMTLAPPTWLFTSGNPSTVKMFGCKNEKDFTSRGPWAYSPKKQPDGQLSGDKAKKMIMKAMKEGTNFFEWTHKKWKGKDFPATVLLTRMTVGGKTFLQATVRDITQQKKAEERFEKVFKNSNDAIMITDVKTQKFVGINKKVTELLGYSKKELLTMTIRSITPLGELPVLIKIMPKLLTKKSLIVETQVLNKNKKKIPVELSLSVMEFEGKLSMLGIIRNISDRKELKNKLAVANKTLRAKTREMANKINKFSAANKKLRDKNKTIRKLKKKLGRQ